jgi:hypothetical protein
MLTEGSRRSDQRIGTLDGQFGRKPRPRQHPRFGPRRRREIMLSAQVFGQRRE